MMGLSPCVTYIFRSNHVTLCLQSYNHYKLAISFFENKTYRYARFLHEAKLALKNKNHSTRPKPAGPACFIPLQENNTSAANESTVHRKKEAAATTPNFTAKAVVKTMLNENKDTFQSQ